MDFNESLKAFSAGILDKIPSIQTEEATKMSLVVPFFRILGYDVFNPDEFCPEFTADVGIKKGEKVDYAILSNGNPSILIECKWCGEQLSKHDSQLFRYFGVTKAKFGILTNGLIYRFYTDLDEANKMDLTPFLEINISELKESSINELKKFCHDSFDSEKIFSTASELRYSNAIKDLLKKEFDDPGDELSRFILSGIYDGQKNQKVIDKFKPIIKKAIASYINEIVNQKISSALEPDEPNVENDEAPVSKIITTEEEIESFYIIRGIKGNPCWIRRYK